MVEPPVLYIPHRLLVMFPNLGLKYVWFSWNYYREKIEKYLLKARNRSAFSGIMKMEAAELCKQSSEENVKHSDAKCKYMEQTAQGNWFLSATEIKKYSNSWPWSDCWRGWKKPRQSVRRLSNLFNVSYSSVRNALKHFKFNAYRPHVLQALNEEDYSQGVAFAK